MDRKKTLFEKMLIGVILVYCISILMYIFSHIDQYQWDFQVYYYAAKAYAEGLNPYDNNALSQVAQSPITLKFVYPPITLLFFRVLLLVKHTTASYLYLLLKCTLLIVLLRVWKNIFLGEIDAFFYLFCLLAFNSPIYLDLLSGNISTLEECLIWFAFYGYLKNKRLLFCLFIVIAAAFKMLLIVLILLLYFSKKAHKYLYMIGSFIAFSAMLLLGYLINPLYFASFMQNISGLNEKRGILIPSTFSLIKNVSRFLGETYNLVIPDYAQLVLYFGIIAIIVFVSWRAYKALRASATQDIERMEIFLACFVYILILPHVRDYSYILLIVPTYFLFRQVRYLAAYPFLMMIAILSDRHVTLPGFPILFSILWEYYPLMIAYLVWGLYVYHFLRYTGNSTPKIL
jgi:hypothetical protein